MKAYYQSYFQQNKAKIKKYQEDWRNKYAPHNVNNYIKKLFDEGKAEELRHDINEYCRRYFYGFDIWCMIDCTDVKFEMIDDFDEFSVEDKMHHKSMVLQQKKQWADDKTVGTPCN